MPFRGVYTQSIVCCLYIHGCQEVHAKQLVCYLLQRGNRVYDLFQHLVQRNQIKGKSLPSIWFVNHNYTYIVG